jgi:GTPase SAR1 family protein
LSALDIPHSKRSTVRTIAIAREREIGHLVIVAGVPTSGKTTVITRLISGSLPELADKLSFDNKRQWTISGYGDLHRHRELDIPGMILHYNITTPMIQNERLGYNGGLVDLMRSAKHISVVTLWCTADELSRRYRHSRVWKPFWKSKRAKREQKNVALLSLYSEPYRLRGLFREWLFFIQDHTSELVMFESNGSDRILSIERWQVEVSQLSEPEKGE